MVFSYYRESTEQPQESTLWDRFLWLTPIEFLFFIGRQIFSLSCSGVCSYHAFYSCSVTNSLNLSSLARLQNEMPSCPVFSPCWGALGGILPGIGSASSEMLMIPIKALFAGPTLSPGNSGSQIIGMPPLKIRGSIWEGLQWGQQHDLLSLCSLRTLWLPALLVSDAGAFYPVSKLHWHPYVTAHSQMGSTISFSSLVARICSTVRKI